MAEYPPHGLHNYDDELKLYIDAGDWSLLTGNDFPFSRTTEYPTDGVWTYSYQSGSWFGPAYAVSWEAGDNVTGPPVIEGTGSGTIQVSRLVGGGRYLSDQPPAIDGVPQYDWPGDGDGLARPATEGGTGIIFLIQQEEDEFGNNPGPTTPMQPDLDVLDYLGDVVLTNGTTVVPWGLDEGDGEEGDFYLQYNAKTLYGPRNADGNWPPGIHLNQPSDGMDIGVQSDIPVLVGYALPGGVADLVDLVNGDNEHVFRVDPSGPVLRSPDGTFYRLVVANDGTLSTEAV